MSCGVMSGCSDGGRMLPLWSVERAISQKSVSRQKMVQVVTYGIKTAYLILRLFTVVETYPVIFMRSPSFLGALPAWHHILK